MLYLESIQKRKIDGRKQEGFTLMELMVGISLFALALFPVMTVLANSLAFGKFSENRVLAMNQTRRTIENIRRVSDASGLATVVSTNWNQNLSSVLTGGNLTVTDLSGNPLQNNADPLPIRVGVTWTEKGKTAAYRIETKVTQR